LSIRALTPLMFHVAIFKACILWQAIRTGADQNGWSN